MLGIDRLRRRLPTKVAALLVAVPVIGAASMAVAGQIASPSSVQVTNLLKTRLPKTQLSQVDCEKVHGLCEVTAGANLFYVDAGARYLIIGRVYDMETRQDLTAARLLEINPDMLVGGAAKANAALSGMRERPIRWLVDDAAKFTAREVRRGRRYDGIILDPPKFGRGPEGEVWRLEEGLPGLIADCRKLLDADSRFLVLTVYAVRMSALAIGELLRQALGDLGGTVECGDMAVREEARGLLLPTAIFARWSND